MNYDYLAKIRGAVTLYTKHKTSNILEGGFRSLYRGRSLEFDDLKEYDFGDNVHDIDWKSSSRSGKILIRRYVAEKKHNVLFVCDSGPKMDAHTSAGCSKTELALMIFGDLDLSVIDEMLPGRQPTETYLISGEKRSRLYGFIKKHIEKGNLK